MKITDSNLYEKCCLDAVKQKELLVTNDEKRIYAKAIYAATMWGRKQDELAERERQEYLEAYRYPKF